MTLLVNDRYALRRLLGTGGMGRVYLVQDLTEEGLLVALKTLAPGVSAEEGHPYLESEFLTLADLAHPHIPQVYDFDRVRFVVDEGSGGAEDFHLPEGLPFFVRDYVSGRSMMASTENMAQRDVLRLLLDLTNAIAYLHRQGLLHRDIKPDNVMVSGLGTDRVPRVKLMDFGLATLEENALGAVGTLRYVAPEIMHGARWSPTSEAFSLGLIFFEALARRPAFEGESAADLAKAHTRELPQLPTELPESIKEIIQNLLQIDPRRRSSVNATAVALQKALELNDNRNLFRIPLGSSRLSGRARELELIYSVIEGVTCTQAHGGTATGRCLFLSGPPGIGKTRLLKTLRHNALVNGIRFFAASCQPNSDAFAATRSLLRPLLHERPDLVTPEREVLRTVLVDKPRSRMEHRPDDISPRQAIVRVFDAARTLLESAAAEQPIVLALEDLQWADPESVELFQHLARHLVRAPIVLVGTSWPPSQSAPEIEGLLAELARAPMGLDHIQLEGMDAETIRLMLRRAVGPSEVQEAVVDRLRDQTEGNPLFIEEILKLTRGTSSLDAILETPQLPTAVGDAFRQQVLAMSAEALTAVKGLAVWGTPASSSELVIITQQDRSRTLQGLEEALACQLVKEQGNSYWFSHRVVVQIVEELMTDLETRDFHHRAGKHREASRELHDPERIDRLVTHFTKADQPVMALGYALTGARMAEERFLARRAVELYERARDLGIRALGHAYAGTAGLIEVRERLARLYTWTGEYGKAETEARSLLEDGWVKWDQATCARLRALLGDVSARRGAPEEALHHFQSALEGSIDARSSAEVWSKIAEVHLRTGHYDDARLACARALERLEGIDAPVLRATIAFHLGKCSQQQGNYPDALERFTEARKLYLKAKYQPGVASTMNASAQIYTNQEQYAEAVKALQAALALQEHLGDVEGMAVTLDRLALATWGMQDMRAAITYATRGLETYQRIGSAHGEGRALATLGLIQYAVGDYGEALRRFEQAIIQQKRAGDESSLIVSHQNLGLTYLELGAQKEAEAVVNTALELARKSGSRGREARCFQLLGHIASQKGNTKEARGLLEKALEVFTELKHPAQIADVYCVLAENALMERDFDAARDLSNKALELAGDGKPPILVQIQTLRCRIEMESQGTKPAQLMEALDQAELLANELNQTDFLWQLWTMKGETLLRAGRPREACRLTTRAMEIIRAYYEQLPPQWRAAFLADPRRQEVRMTLEKAVRSLQAR